VGWLLWAALSAAMLAAAYGLGVRSGGTLFERAAAATAALFGLIVCATWSAGALGLLAPAPLTGFALLVCAVACGVAGRGVLRSLPSTLRADLLEVRELWRDLRRDSLPLFLLVAGGVVLWLWTWVPVLLFRTWNFDATVYHAPLAHLFVQHGSTARLFTPSIWMEGYPYAGSLIAVWNIIFPRDTLLDDASQLPSVVLLVSVVAAWLVRLEVKPHLALGFGSALLFMPTVFLQLGHGQVDLWCAGLLSLAVYQLVFRGDRESLFVFFACMALYAATKLSGLLHLALAFPLFAWAVWARHRARGGKALAWDLSWGALLYAGLGLPRYVENFLARGTPTFPFSLRIPFGPVLQGATEAHQHFQGYAGYSGALFTSPGAIPAIFGSWYHLRPNYWPDVRTGGFGWAFAFLVVPASALVWLVWTRRKNFRALLPLVWLALMALAMPTPWWGRYTLPAAMVGLVCTGWGWSQLPRFQRAAAWALSLVSLGGVLFIAAWVWHDRDFYGWPKHLAEAATKGHPARAEIQVTPWLWPPEASALREALPEGALVVHDDSADYFSEYFGRFLRARVDYVSPADARAFADAVYARKAAIVGVRKGGLAELELRARGATLLAPAPRTETALYTLGF
jgi:hypothetical protein